MNLQGRNIYRDDIREKLVVVHYSVAVEQLVRLNYTAALAINENLFSLLKPTWDSPNLGSNFREDYYQMREKLRKLTM